MGQLTEAESSLRRELNISPTHAWGHYNLAYVLVEQGDRDGALSEIQRETNRDFKEMGLAMVLHALGRKTESDAALAWFIKEHAGTYAVSIADIYALRGQSDEALRWLERAFTQRDSNLLMIKADTALVPLDGDPRFKALLRKIRSNGERKGRTVSLALASPKQSVVNDRRGAELTVGLGGAGRSASTWKDRSAPVACA